MNVFALHLTPKYGASIEEVAAKAVELCELLGVDILFDFNGVRCIVNLEMNTLNVIENYRRAR